MAARRLTDTTDLTDEEWQMLAPLLPPEQAGGRPRQYPLREVMHGMQQVRRGGGAWRLRPHDLPHWQTAQQCCRTWPQDGTWLRLHDQLRAEVRTPMGRQAHPSAAVIEAQPVKTTEQGGSTATRGGKKRKGRTRHLLVETTGLLRRVLVHAADRREAATAPWLLAAALATYTQWRRIGADMASRSHALRLWRAADWRGDLEMVQRPRRWGRYPMDVEPPPMPALTVWPRRWVVERTLAQIGRYRRLSNESAYLPEHSETMLDVAMSRLMRRRLARHAPDGVPSPQRQGLRGLARAFSTASRATVVDRTMASGHDHLGRRS